MKDKEWFENWFHEKYDLLYPHRSLEQAQNQVSKVLNFLDLKKQKPWLDLGCGAGRHLRFLNRENPTFGMDLSAYLLGQVPKENPACRADLRKIPFKNQSVEAVFSFFTSFGYFASQEEDLGVLKEYARVLDKGGILYLDLMNPAPLLKNLPNEDSKVLADGSHVTQKRFFAEGKVCKDIFWKTPKGEEHIFKERVRLYSLNEMVDFAKSCSLKFKNVLGSENAEAYDEASSQRMSMVFERV